MSVDAFVVRNREELAQAFDRIRSNDETLTDLDLSELDFVYQNVEGRPLTDAEANGLTAALSVNNRVEHLNIKGCLSRIASPDVLRSLLEVVLSNHPSLKIVRMGKNRLWDVDVVQIAELLKTNTTLTTLVLDSNEFGIKGVRALAEALSVNKTLEELDLYRNNVHDVGSQAIALVLPKSSLKILRLRCNYIGKDGARAISEGLAKNKSLKQLYLGCNHYISYEGCCFIARALCRNSSLCELNLYDNRITAAGADALEASLQHMNYTLETMDLSRNDGVNEMQRNRINLLCQNNIEIKRAYTQMQVELQVLSFCLWSRTLALLKDKPDLLYAMLKSKPDLCREPHTSRRRSRTSGLN